MGANERQVGGTHYKTGGEEHWDRVHRLGLDYFQGQITKYVERWKLKNGIQDLEKARHFLDKYIELEKGKLVVQGQGQPIPRGGIAPAGHPGQAISAQVGHGGVALTPSD
jgi:hypothetical protein